MTILRAFVLIAYNKFWTFAVDFGITAGKSTKTQVTCKPSMVMLVDKLDRPMQYGHTETTLRTYSCLQVLNKSSLQEIEMDACLRQMGFYTQVSVIIYLQVKSPSMKDGLSNNTD